MLGSKCIRSVFRAVEIVYGDDFFLRLWGVGMFRMQHLQIGYIFTDVIR